VVVSAAMCYRLQNIQVIFLLLGIAMGLFAIVLLLFGFASTGLTRETICDGTKCVRSGIGCAVLVSSTLVFVVVIGLNIYSALYGVWSLLYVGWSYCMKPESRTACWISMNRLLDNCNLGTGLQCHIWRGEICRARSQVSAH